MDIAQLCEFWGEKEGVEKVDIRVFGEVQVFGKGKGRFDFSIVFRMCLSHMREKDMDAFFLARMLKERKEGHYG